MKAAQFTFLTADESADFMALSLKARLPFFFTKYGDGALECIYRCGGSQTRDREMYTQELADGLRRSWCELNGDPGLNLYLADWLSTSFDVRNTGRHEERYREFVSLASPTWVHFDALLIDRESVSLLNFYHTLKQDPRRKVIMGPAEWAPAVRMLNAQAHIVTPLSGLLDHVADLGESLQCWDADIVLYGAGMAGTIPVIGQFLSRRDATYINLGSALDPLFRCNSRMNQLSMAKARRFFKRLL